MAEDRLSGEFELNKNTNLDSSNNPAPKETTNDEDKPQVERQSTDNSTKKPEEPERKTNSHFFSSFCYYPKNVKFANQEHDEEIILLIRRRFIVNVPWIVTAVFFAVLGPFLIPLILNALPIAPLTTFQYISINVLYLLLIFGLVLMRFTLWYFHVGLLTNKRIKDIDIHGVLFKDIAEARINQIQDVSNKQIGFLPSLFNYGDIFVQTAGAKPNIEFDRAPQPARIAKIIGDMIGKR